MNPDRILYSIHPKPIPSPTDHQRGIIGEILTKLEHLISSACFFPETDYGTLEMLVSAEHIGILDELLAEYETTLEKSDG